MTDRHSVLSQHEMVLRASTGAKGVAHWLSLPVEIRLMILEAIVQQKHPGWASLAAVCREWQFVIEKQNFHQLKLQVSCLENLERLVVRQRQLVRRIQFDIELPTYACGCCSRNESLSGSVGNSAVISDGIWELFRILSTWQPAGTRGDGLTLELNAYCPSDSKHWFRNCYFASDDEGNGRNEDDDAQHGWVNGRRVLNPPPEAILRLFGSIQLSFLEQLPRVDSVKYLVIRRQFRRCLLPVSVKCILEKLCCLEELIYEPWRQWRAGWREVHDRQFRQLVQHSLPETLRRVTVFEDFCEYLAAVLDISHTPLGWIDQVNVSRVGDPQIGAAFAARSLNLEQLSVSYMIDAKDFFQACLPTWTWPRLQSLALTSQLLQPGNEPKIDALLYQAGVTALRMPKLQTLVLWNGQKKDACAFIYQTHRRGGHASVTWRGTWGLELSPRVVDVWQRVASETGSFHSALRVSKEQVHGAIRTHGDAIHELDLPCRVVEPGSLWQIRREVTIIDED